MGREIKFRVWDLLRSRMLQWGDIFDLPAWEIFPGTPGQRPFIVMQYTGLKDKNGREIYEGDIVTYTDPAMGGFNDMTGVVEYFECALWINDERRSFANPLFCETTELEVIGNIFENPEMLEGRNDERFKNSSQLP